MILLDATNRSLQITLSAAKTTNDCPFVASYVDIAQTGFAMQNASTQDGTSNGTSVVTILAAPGAGNTRQLKYFSLYNADTVAVSVTVTYNDNSTLRKMVTFIIAVGSALVYNAEKGWSTTANGATISGFQLITASGNFTTPAATLSTSLFKFTLVGGGGGSGASTNAFSGGGGGGGAAPPAIYFATGLAPSTAYAIVIGAGGTPNGTTTGTYANNGGNSTLVIGATTITSAGGVGGENTSSASGGTGGAGGAATNPSIPTAGNAGNDGSNADATTAYGEGGNGGAGPWGGSGVGNNNGAGGNGLGYGSGAGGGAVGAGATGAGGVCLVEWHL